MERPPKIQRAALAITKWIGSPSSIIIHTIVFALSFGVTLIGLLPFDEMLLILTMVLSLEAIYLALFIQLTVNYTSHSIKEVGEDIEEIQEDVGEMQEDIEEISEDVEEISIEDEARGAIEEARKATQQKTLADIQTDLKRLMEDIDRLKSSRGE